MAKEVGLRIPDTIVTSDGREAREFLERMNGRAVFKVLDGVRQRLTETRRFRREYTRSLDALRYAPVIFQELIEAELDIRVTIVDEAVFPVSIRPQGRRARLDWRLDLCTYVARASRRKNH
jgi:glutathione synthase/RimK-type ligase-like ATP-grasp enzyme